VPAHDDVGDAEHGHRVLDRGSLGARACLADLPVAVLGHDVARRTQLEELARPGAGEQ
jgi:hypothetical protein